VRNSFFPRQKSARKILCRHFLTKILEINFSIFEKFSNFFQKFLIF
jgi:hypothetical protein